MIRSEARGPLTFLHAAGSLDETALDEIEVAWRRVASPAHVLVDLSGATHADEGTWAFFAEAARRIRRAGGTFAIFGAQGTVRNSLFVSGLIARLTFHESEAEAVAYARKALPGAKEEEPAAETDAASGSELDRLARVLAFLKEQIAWHQAAGISEVLRPLEHERREKTAMYESLLQRRGLQRTAHESAALAAKPAAKDASAFAATGRRVFARYRVNLTATLEWPGRTELAAIRNISEGGVGIGTNHGLAAGEKASVRIMNLPGSPPVKLVTEVRWCKRVAQVGAFDYESGLLFVGEATQELLALRASVRSLAGRAPEVPWS